MLYDFGRLLQLRGKQNVSSMSDVGKLASDGGKWNRQIKIKNVMQWFVN